MASTIRHSPNAFPAEVARYLAVEPLEIKRLIRLAKLPAIKLPAATRPVYRIPLRDFHAWLVDRTTNPAPQLRHYDTFLADFDDAARSKKP
jgi:hypothetical protein